MIGLDTNVVVRYLVHDDPVQTRAALRLFDSLSPDAPGFLSHIVIVELVWVIESSYGFNKKEVVVVVETLLQSKELVVERAEVVWSALRAFIASRADFTDCLIEGCSHAANCDYTVTFDKKAASAGMRLLS